MSNLFSEKEYKPRLIDATVEDYMASSGALCIEGPKWCGKTWTSAFHSKSEFFVGNPDNNFSNRALAELNPSLVLKGDNPRLIDEWQEVPSLWDAVRAEVDKKNKYGLIILTGSSTPKTKGIMHSGAGRIVNIRMNTMSLYESGDSTGVVSLKKLSSMDFEEQLTGEVDLEKLAYLIVRGGWPKNIEAKNPCVTPKSYVEKIIEGNLTNEDGRKYSKEKIEHILKSLARNESTTASISKIARDIEEFDGKTVSPDTVSIYMEEMSRMFLFNNQLPFDQNIRSSLRVKGAVKRHFCDPALACALLNLNEEKLMNNLTTFGFMFEALVERDLSVYAQAIGGTLYHYQNYDNDEIDSVIEFENGDWAAIEIKLGANKIDEAAMNLNRVCNKITDNGGKAPIFKCVICGLTNAAYKRADDVYVLPITALRP